MNKMHVHEDVLSAALRICRERGDWTFSPNEIVRALPDKNPQTVRTHVTSRCCVNAPKNHLHKWDYFRRIGHACYEILPSCRSSGRRRGKSAKPMDLTDWSAGADGARRDTIHAVISKSDNLFVAECLEIAVVTQGRTVDESLANLREAVTLHLEGEDLEEMGLSERPRLSVAYEMPISLDGEA